MLKLKEEGNRLFGRKEYQKALESYDRALKVVNVEAKEDLALLHSNKAACFMMFQRCAATVCHILVLVIPKELPLALPSHSSHWTNRHALGLWGGPA